MIDTLIENIKKKINLSLDETEQLFDKIFNGEVDTSSLTSLLDALDKKGETPDELAGATTSMRKNSKSIDVNHNQVIDCCGTGGLGKKMINVSTSVSFGVNTPTLSTKCVAPVCIMRIFVPFFIVPSYTLMRAITPK